ncbi:MAG: hypothetical protein RL173_140 [Fibrobacterota bacterium]
MNKNFKNRRISPQDIARFTTVELVRPAQFVQAAFLVSAAVVSTMTALARPMTTNPGAMGLVQIVGMVGMLLWVAGYAVGLWLFKKRTTRDALLEVLDAPFRGPAALAKQATDADKISHHLRKAWVMRTGAWEAGPILCLLSVQIAIQGNLLATQPSMMTTGVVPMIAFLVLCVMTWPTQKRQAEVLEKALLQN